MKFLIEKSYDVTEKKIIMELLERTKFLHSFEFADNSLFVDIDEDGNKSFRTVDEKYKEYVPIGSIPFVNNYLKTLFGIESQNPIEIPKSLRTPEFLKRNYSVVKASDLPRTGKKFIKDVTELKNFSYAGQLEYFLFDEMFTDEVDEFDHTLKIKSNHLYQVSDYVNILSEWRVYIIDGKIVNISNYNGDTTLFPDIDLIKKANNVYSTQPDYPKSYSFDVLVSKNGTAIIEVHTFSSLGLYHTLWPDDLLYAYYDAKEYILNHNTVIEEFNVKIN